MSSTSRAELAALVTDLKRLLDKAVLNDRQRQDIWALKKRATEDDEVTPPPPVYALTERRKWVSENRFRSFPVSEAQRLLKQQVELLKEGKPILNLVDAGDSSFATGIQDFDQPDPSKPTTAAANGAAGTRMTVIAAPTAQHADMTTMSSAMVEASFAKAGAGLPAHQHSTAPASDASLIAITPQSSSQQHISHVTPEKRYSMSAVPMRRATGIPVELMHSPLTRQVSPSFTAPLPHKYLNTTGHILGTKKCGYLLKRADIKHNWNIRWFYLKDCVLHYFHSYADYVKAESANKILPKQCFVLNRECKVTEVTKINKPDADKVARNFAEQERMVPTGLGTTLYSSSTSTTSTSIASDPPIPSDQYDRFPIYVNRGVGREFHPFQVRLADGKSLYLAATISSSELDYWLTTIKSTYELQPAFAQRARYASYMTNYDDEAMFIASPGAASLGEAAGSPLGHMTPHHPPTHNITTATNIHTTSMQSITVTAAVATAAGTGVTAVAGIAGRRSSMAAHPSTDANTNGTNTNINNTTATSHIDAINNIDHTFTGADEIDAEEEPPTIPTCHFKPAGQPEEPYSLLLGQKLQKLRDLASDPEPHWELRGTDAGVTCYTSKDGTPAARGEGFIPYPRRALWELLADIDRRAETDSQFDFGRVIQRWNQHSTVTHMKFKRVFPTSARDFCNATHWCVEEDGTLIIFAWSVQHPDCPEKSDPVRAHLEIGGWIIRPRPGAEALRRKYGAEIDAGTRPPPYLDPEIDSEGCDCVYLMRSDFRGSIPQRITAGVAAQQAKLVATVKNRLDELYSIGGSAGPRAVQELRKMTLTNEGQESWKPIEQRRMKARAAPKPTGAPQSPPPAPCPTLRRRVYKYYPPLPLHDRLANELEDRVRMMLELAADTSNKWILKGTNAGVTSYVGTDDTPSAKGVGVLPYPRRAIWDTLVRIEQKPETDEQCELGVCLHQWNLHSSISYMLYRGAPFVEKRDFVNLTHWRILEDGTLIIVAWSIDDSHRPPIKGVTRGHVEIGGWVIRPLPGAAALRAKYGDQIADGNRCLPHSDPEIDDQGCECTYLMRSDFKGSIPTAITRRVAAQQSSMVLKLKSVLDQKFGEGGALGPQELERMRRMPLVNIPEMEAEVEAASYAAAGELVTPSESAAAEVGRSSFVSVAAPHQAQPGPVAVADTFTATKITNMTPERPSGARFITPVDAALAACASYLRTLTKQFPPMAPPPEQLQASLFGGPTNEIFDCHLPSQSELPPQLQDYSPIADLSAELVYGIHHRASKSGKHTAAGMVHPVDHHIEKMVEWQPIPATCLMVLCMLLDPDTFARLDLSILHTQLYAAGPVDRRFQLGHITQHIVDGCLPASTKLLVHYRVVTLSDESLRGPAILALRVALPESADEGRNRPMQLSALSFIDGYFIAPSGSTCKVARVLWMRSALVSLLPATYAEDVLINLRRLCDASKSEARHDGMLNFSTFEESKLFKPLGYACQTIPLLERHHNLDLSQDRAGRRRPFAAVDAAAESISINPRSATKQLPALWRSMSAAVIVATTVYMLWIGFMLHVKAVPPSAIINLVVLLFSWYWLETPKSTNSSGNLHRRQIKVRQNLLALQLLQRQWRLAKRPPLHVSHSMILPSTPAKQLVDALCTSEGGMTCVNYPILVAKASAVALARVLHNLDFAPSADVPFHAAIHAQYLCSSIAPLPDMPNVSFEQSICVPLPDASARSASDMSLDVVASGSREQLGSATCGNGSLADGAMPLILIYAPAFDDPTQQRKSDLSAAAFACGADRAAQLLCAPIQLRVSPVPPTPNSTVNNASEPGILVEVAIDNVLSKVSSLFFKELAAVIRAPERLDSLRVYLG